MIQLLPPLTMEGIMCPDPVLVKQREGEELNNFYYRFSTAWEEAHQEKLFTRNQRTSLFAMSLTDDRLYRRFQEHRAGSGCLAYLQDWDPVQKEALQALPASEDRKSYQQLLELYLLTTKEWNPNRIDGYIWDSTFYIPQEKPKVIPPRPDDTEIRNTGARRKERKQNILQDSPLYSSKEEEVETNRETAEIYYRIVSGIGGRESFEAIGLIQYPHGKIVQ
jgi:hypothetical protein